MCSLTEPVVTRHHLIVYMHFRGTFLRVRFSSVTPGHVPGAGGASDGWMRAGRRCVCFAPGAMGCGGCPVAVASAQPAEVGWVACAVEYFRISNTGKLLMHVWPGAQVCVSGILSMEREMMAHIERHRDSTYVLYPDASARSVQDVLRVHAAPADTPTTDTTTSTAITTKPLTLIVLDGTWSQARMLYRRLPAGVQKLRLQPPSGSQFFLRRQTQVCGDSK